MRYTAINLGPIVITLMMARRPRELWSASYLFSHLMKCVIESLPATSKIISPAILAGDDLKLGVGLYPDRVFIEGDIGEIDFILNGAWSRFCDSFKIRGEDKAVLSITLLKRNYFNLMSVSCDAESEARAIKILNSELDKLELLRYALDEEDQIPVLRLIKMKEGSPLFTIATDVSKFPVESLGEIAAVEKKGHDENWRKFRKILLSEKDKENDPYVLGFGSDYKSYHKYICIVQADGDNVGKTVSHEMLPDGKVGEISKALLDFGKKAKEAIDAFGGLPIYAGGDDLLFIAPVVGKNHTTIFDLLDTIDRDCFSEVAKTIDGLGLETEKEVGGIKKRIEIKASLSYGISISYYKYPLYEALATARHLLFDVAKRIGEKNAIAWKFRKHSGSGFEAAFSKGNVALKDALKDVIENTSDGNTVSAVAHKIRINEVLVGEVMKSKDNSRLNALFEKLLEYTGTPYFDAVKKIMPILYEAMGKENYATTLYNMLRTAKFIKGEEPNDE